MVVCKNESTRTKNVGELLIAGDFDCHADAEVRRGAHRPMEHVQGFTGSQWMPPSGKCLRRIAQAADMVNEFVETAQNTNKTQV
jgi:hypothetical protein